MLTPQANTLVLYADDGYLSHQVRLALCVKKIEFNEIDIRHDWEQLEDLADINPYNTLPVLVQRDLILYRNTVIFEYLEERYPQTKLLPETPIERANYRQLCWRIEHDWVKLADILLTHPDTLDIQQAKKARQQLTDSLVTLSPLFAHQSYFLSDKFGLCDCILVSILCRLSLMQIDLPKHLTRPLLQYMDRIFALPSVKKSMSPLTL
ncbi:MULTISPECIES: glutathione S-transferase N-terminal domain-containing protein [unclassified Moraxella]|uniref:glutathione S-transferase N-terminal domain-containing protein n=1 Tax=unclassified Moraxella TaxID=2685852 RepID=UPI003AF5A89C